LRRTVRVLVRQRTASLAKDAIRASTARIYACVRSRRGGRRSSGLVGGVDGLLFSAALAAEGAVVFAKACELGLEGIVSKRAGSFYKNGPSRNWLKTKNPDFVRT